MSDTVGITVQQLTEENKNLKKQIEDNSNGVQSLLAQAEALRGTVNEQLGMIIALRTNISLLQKANQDLNLKLQSTGA